MPDIPAAIRSRLEHHMGLIKRTHQAIYDARQTEALVGIPGRYEWEYRTTNFPDLDPSLAFFTLFECTAQAKGIDPKAVYDDYGGKPQLEPWSEEALKWIEPGV